MIVYWDSSIILALALKEPHQLGNWRTYETRVGSELVEVECFRALDRIQLVGRSSQEELLKARDRLFVLRSMLDVVPLDRGILRRASDPFPLPVRTLDAIHLASAIAWREENRAEIIFATHDKALAKAATAMGFQIVGIG